MKVAGSPVVVLVVRGLRRVIAIACFLAGLLPAVAFASDEGGFISLDKSLIIQAVNFLILLVLVAIFNRMVAKQPDDRWQSARDLRAYLQHTQASPSVAAADSE